MENVVIKTSARLRNQYNPEEGFPEIQYAKLNSFRLNEIRIYFQLGLTVTSKLTNLSSDPVEPTMSMRRIRHSGTLE